MLMPMPEPGVTEHSALLLPILWGLIALLGAALLMTARLLLPRYIITPEALAKALQTHHESCSSEVAVMIKRLEARLNEGDLEFRRTRQVNTSTLALVQTLCEALHFEELDCAEVRAAIAKVNEV